MLDARIFSAMAQLRSVLRTLELELGLADLSKGEMDVLAAAIQIANSSKNNVASAPQILDHALVQQLGRSTIYRSITSLEERGFLVTSKPGHNSEYSLNLSKA